MQASLPSNWSALDFSQMDENFADFYRRLQVRADSASQIFCETFSPEQAHPIHVAFLADKTINARACLENGQYFIGIHAALPCILHFLFNTLLRTPVYYPGVGSLQGDDYAIYARGIPTSLPDACDLYQALALIVSSSRPICDQRAAAASQLTELAVGFCVYHELAHIQTGHVASNCNLFGEREFLEFFGWNFPPDARRIARVWEYEADKIAAIMLAGNDLLNKDNQQYFMETFAVDCNWEFHQILGLLCSALFVLFHLMNQKRPFLGFLSNHPHPALRYSYVCSEIINFSIRHMNLDGEQEQILKENIANDILMSRDAWNLLQLPRAKDIASENFHRWAGAGMDKMEKDRRAVNYLYKEKAWIYPFVD